MLNWEIELAETLYGVDEVDSDFSAKLLGVVCDLPYRQVDMFYKYHQDGMSLAEISNYYGVVNGVVLADLEKVETFLKRPANKVKLLNTNNGTSLDTSISELDIPKRVYSILYNNNIKTVEDIINYDELYGLGSIRNLGAKSIELLEEVLTGLGVVFSRQFKCCHIRELSFVSKEVADILRNYGILNLFMLHNVNLVNCNMTDDEKVLFKRDFNKYLKFIRFS